MSGARASSAVRLPAIVGLLLLACLAACVSVPQYDAQTDAAISGLQKTIDGQLVQWMSQASSDDPQVRDKARFAESADFYDTVETDLTSLELRIEAVQDRSTANMPQIFANLRQQLANLKTSHRTNGVLSPTFVRITRKQLNAQFAILLTYELSLKGVASPGKASTQSTATTSAGASGGDGQ